MIHEFTRVTVVRIKKPIKKDVNEDLQWLGSSLGLFKLRDRNSSCFRVFIELLKNARQHKSVSSDELAFKTHLSRGTVVHHLHNLIAAGLVIPENSQYILRETNLEKIVDKIKRDINSIFDEIKSMAEELDDELNLEKR